MSFLESYKRLDNLCKDMFAGDKGVTAYIEKMERYSDASYKIRDWDSDYRKLKHYRYIRNKLVHENHATEKNMCDEADVQWINNFYQRIIKKTDPLARYQQWLNGSKTAQQTKSKSRGQTKKHRASKTNRYSHYLVNLLISALVVIAVAALVYYMLQTK